MRLILLMAVLMPICGLPRPGLAQPANRQPESRQVRPDKPTEYSASSEWQRVTLKPTARLEPGAQSTRRTAPAERPSGGQPAEAVAADAPAETAPGTTNAPSAAGGGTSRSAAARSGTFRPAFTGDFSTNRNGWKAGNQGDYNFQIGLGRYSMRKRNNSTKQIAFSYISLPPDINLNRADTFSIRVDVLADSGQVPTGGLLFGVRDSLNYCAFTTNSQGEISIKRVMNGVVMTDYMPGEYFRPGVVLDKNRNRLTIKRRGDALHFYVNDQEVRSSPYPFRVLSGNGIGLMASGYWTQFQKLNVALGP